MDLFEILFIALFILFPVFEGILRQRRKSRGPGPGEPEDEAPSGGVEAGGEPRSAAEMLPEDLWELMTGERRPADHQPGSESPWSTEPDTATAERPEEERAAEATEDWRDEPWAVDDEAERVGTGSIEYEGPEAYSLETAAPPARSLERPIPTPSARHQAFRRTIDGGPPAVRRRPSRLIRSLGSPDGLRQAVLAREILGPPKGLE